eukprot:11382015-Ditylum_brightwellii.AAC.1
MPVIKKVVSDVDWVMFNPDRTVSLIISGSGCLTAVQTAYRPGARTFIAKLNVQSRRAWYRNFSTEILGQKVTPT